MALGTGLLWAAPPDSSQLGEELAELAQALRQDPSPANYESLSGFAEKHKGSELGAQAAFALGMADKEAERWSEARERFRAAGSSRWLGERAALEQARSELELGALDAAGRTLTGLFSASDPVGSAARVLEVERLLKLGQARAAIEWLEAQPDLRHQPALLQALARAQRAAGDPVRAAETLHRIYYEFPLSPEAEPSNEMLAEIRVELKERYPSPSQTLRRVRAERLWARRAYRGARSAYLDLSVRASEPTRTEARLRAAESLYHLGAGHVACRELKGVPGVPPALKAEYSAFRVRCALRGGRYWEAEEELDTLAEHFPRSEWFEEALLVAGRTALAQSEFSRARDYYRRLLREFPKSRSAPEAHWKVAWLAFRGREPEANRLLEEHLQRFPDSRFVERALYWRARTAMEAGADSVARRLLAALRDYAPRDYLAQKAEALLAQLRRTGAANGDGYPWLEKLLPARAQTGPMPPPLPPAVRAELEKAAVLERLAYPEMAGEVLEVAARKWPHPELDLARARLAFAEGKYALATEILRRTYPEHRRYSLEALPRQAWEILFPRPYWEAIAGEAHRQGLDPYLVAALIRQESRFEREAASSAGALGLMQLMPGTARYLARSRRLSRERILQPELNIRLGTRFLAQLLERFDGQLEKAVAGYNAGGTRVENWASKNDYTEAAEFVEDIPVEQTREFVYKVLRNYRYYRDLYGEPEQRAAQP